MTQYFKLTILFLLSFIALSHYSFAEIIPADKRINWSPGIPGGIPNYSATRNAVTQHGAVGDGITDDTFAIQSCINALTSMQVCYLPPGTYKVTSQLNMFTAQTALRGAGANSKIISYGLSGDIINIGSGIEGSLINILSGYTKDSTSLIFADAATISSILVGDYIVVVQSNDSFVDPTGYNGCTYCGLNDDETKAMNQIVRVINKVDNILTIHKPLYFTFQASLTPQIIESLPAPINEAKSLLLTLKNQGSAPVEFKNNLEYSDGLFLLFNVLGNNYDVPDLTRASFTIQPSSSMIYRIKVVPLTIGDKNVLINFDNLGTCSNISDSYSFKITGFSTGSTTFSVAQVSSWDWAVALMLSVIPGLILYRKLKTQAGGHPPPLR